ncbi:isoprenylcysteine carboxylmethyltransferase family protein [Croceibacter atlanticus]|uniref:methyltransferase family protein n=1 Tax=Croceibacter atlanticus TaxID=313588 RepID=UPI0030DCF4B4|tara:strand:- start:163397 stop:163849 length:453 start_codon:yes stop_codon:yes gene_type:complete
MSINTPKYKDYIFVGVQLLLFAGYVVPFKIITLNLPEWLRYSGLVLVVFGIILGVTALVQINTKLSPFPTPVSNSKLLTNGAFGIARHPIYTALVLAGLGYAIHQESVLKILVTGLLLILFYFKSKYEEHLLSQKFPEYKQYQMKTRRFL